MLDGEKEIIERAVLGEASAFGLLYDHYQPVIYRFVMIKVGHREDAEDLTHQVFLAALRRVHEYRESGFPFSSWLYRIARNLVVDHYRTKRQNVPLEEAEEHPAAVDSPETMTERSLAAAKVMQAIGELPEAQQDIVIMRFVEDLSIKDVAAAVGKTEGAVKLLQHRATKRLKEILARRS